MNDDDESLASAYKTRRATLEDLPRLRALWQGERLPDEELEKRFTEFQIALNADDEIAGSVGLQMNKLHGLVHSEVFTNPQDAAEIRPLLWSRILTVAKNNGLVRLWALPTTSFYREQGMTDIDDALRAKLPEGFGSPLADWVTLKLKEENPGPGSIEKEFEVFAMAQRVESERLISQAKALRMIAYGLLIVALGALGALAWVFGRLRRR
jgi:N-acetylglutamate synthase-like GNAT family acetyltransferase